MCYIASINNHQEPRTKNQEPEHARRGAGRQPIQVKHTIHAKCSAGIHGTYLHVTLIYEHFKNSLRIFTLLKNC